MNKIKQTGDNVTNKYSVTAASFLMSEGCNMGCTYCFEAPRNGPGHFKMMSNDVISSSIEFLCKQAIDGKKREINVTLFGGEPMLNIPGLKFFINKSIDIKTKYGIQMQTTIITNGTIISDETVNILTKYKDVIGLSVQISIDGTAEDHNKYRILKNGSPTYDIIVNNIPKWKRIFTTDSKETDQHRICVHGCLNADTIKNTYSHYKALLATGIEGIWLMPIHASNYSKENVEEYRLGLIDIKNDLVEKLKTAKSKEDVRRVASSFAPLDRILSDNGRFPEAPCGAGKNYVSMTASGDIYPCHQFYYNDVGTKIGNIYTGIDTMRARVYEKYDNRDISCEKNCKATGCYRCIGDHYFINGSIFSTILGPRCQMSKVEMVIQKEFKEEYEKALGEVT